MLVKSEASLTRSQDGLQAEKEAVQQPATDLANPRSDAVLLGVVFKRILRQDQPEIGRGRSAASSFSDQVH